MIWTRSETLALAMPGCAECQGLGLRPSRGKTEAPCNCVLRSIFRACYKRFRECVFEQEKISRATLDFHAARSSKTLWGRKDEEYTADFFLISKRTLTPAEFRLFRYHFLLGADWRLCTWKLKIDRGTFFHAVYRIEQKLGKVFRELQPYGLFPLDEYFHGSYRSRAAVVPIDSTRHQPEPVKLSSRIPLRRIA